MNKIIFTTLENKFPQNKFSFLMLKTIYTTIPNNKIVNMQIVFH